MRALVAIAALSTLCMAACGTGGGKTDGGAVPLPVAWPRLALYDTAFRRLDSVPVPFAVNASTVARVRPGDGGGVWVDVVYPAYCDSSTLYLTFTPVTDATRDAVVANRVERMALNTGDLDTEIITVPSQGADSRVTVTRGATVTPVQFIATTPRMVITGAYYIKETGDSVRPYVDAVTADIIHSLKAL